MGGVCYSKPSTIPNAFDPKDYVSIDIHEEEIARSSEQRNLLRFKVEVLINMLAIEDKKMGSLTKRIEVLKWTMLSKGVSEDGLNNILQSFPGTMVSASPDEKSSIIPAAQLSAFDLSGAIERLRGEFVTNKKDIVQSFADDEGKVVTSLSKDEFMRQLYAATETVSKADIHAIALRFFDGSTVSVVEFIEFFMMPNATRQAKAAASAVRMSLDLLQLDQNHEDLSGKGFDDDDDVDQMQLMLTSSHKTASLDRGTETLRAMWFIVEYDLQDMFDDAQDLGDQVVLVQTFKKILLSACGSKSKSLKLNASRSPKDDVTPLTNDDVSMLSERFEIGGRVHYGHFLQYFREITAPLMLNGSRSSRKSYTAADGSLQVPSGRPIPTVGISPFRMSSEWAALKAEAVKNYGEEREQYQNDMSAIDNRLALLNNESDSKEKNSKSVKDKKYDKYDTEVDDRRNKGSPSESKSLNALSSSPDRKDPLDMSNMTASRRDSKMRKDGRSLTFDDKIEAIDASPLINKSKNRNEMNKFNDKFDQSNKNNDNENKMDNNNNNNKYESKNDRSVKTPPPAKPIRSHLGQYEEVMSDLKREEDRENGNNGVNNGANNGVNNGASNISGGNGNGNNNPNGNINGVNGNNGNGINNLNSPITKSDISSELDNNTPNMPKKSSFFSQNKEGPSSPEKMNNNSAFSNNNKNGNSKNNNNDDNNSSGNNSNNNGNNNGNNNNNFNNNNGSNNANNNDLNNSFKDPTDPPVRKSWIPSFGLGRKSNNSSLNNSLNNSVNNSNGTNSMSMSNIGMSNDNVKNGFNGNGNMGDMNGNVNSNMNTVNSSVNSNMNNMSNTMNSNKNNMSNNMNNNINGMNNNVNNNMNGMSDKMNGMSSNKNDDDLDQTISSLKHPQPALSPTGMSRFLPWGKRAENNMNNGNNGNNGNNNGNNSGSNNGNNSNNGNSNNGNSNNGNSNNGNSNNDNSNNGNNDRRNSNTNDEHMTL